MTMRSRAEIEKKWRAAGWDIDFSNWNFERSFGANISKEVPRYEGDGISSGVRRFPVFTVDISIHTVSQRAAAWEFIDHTLEAMVKFYETPVEN